MSEYAPPESEAAQALASHLAVLQAASDANQVTAVGHSYWLCLCIVKGCIYALLAASIKYVAGLRPELSTTNELPKCYVALKQAALLASLEEEGDASKGGRKSGTAAAATAKAARKAAKKKRRSMAALLPSVPEPAADGHEAAADAAVAGTDAPAADGCTAAAVSNTVAASDTAAPTASTAGPDDRSDKTAAASDTMEPAASTAAASRADAAARKSQESCSSRPPGSNSAADGITRFKLDAWSQPQDEWQTVSSQRKVQPCKALCCCSTRREKDNFVRMSFSSK